jgi:hypothetical protein
VAAQAPAVDRQTLVAAVESYLAQRGVKLSEAAAMPPRPPAAPPSPASRPTFQRPPGLAAPVTSAALGTVAAEVVDRFLSARRSNPAPAPPVPPPAECACAHEPAGADVNPAATAITVVDFVCEDDVRAALRDSRKIYIGPKTIVTPSARDLGEQHGILVLAQR